MFRLGSQVHCESGQSVIIRDYRQSTKPNWTQGTVSEQTGPVSNRVQMSPEVTWRRHVDQMQHSQFSRGGGDKSNDQSVSDIRPSVSEICSPIPEIHPSSPEVCSSVPEKSSSVAKVKPQSVGTCKNTPSIQQSPSSGIRRDPKRNVGPPSRYKDYEP